MPLEPQDLLELLHSYALRSRSADVDLRAFLGSLPVGRGTMDDIRSALRRLSETGELTLYETDGEPATVFLPGFPLIALVERYRKLGIDASLPFPTEETAPIALTAGDITPVDVKSQLGPLFQEKAAAEPGVVKILFPENVRPLIVPRSCVSTLLVDASVLRISAYLQSSQNFTYVETKLGVALRGSEISMRQALEEATHRPRSAAAGVTSPSDFGFRFWTQLCGVILQDVSAKEKLTEEDQAVCQSAHAVTYAVFHRKAEIQREQARAADRKALERRVHGAPFLFSEQDLFDLADEKGTTFSSKHGMEFIRAFVAEKTRPTDDQGLPQLVRLRSEGEGTDYIIHRDMIVPVFLSRLAEAADSLRLVYVESWTADMKRDLTPRPTKSDAVFRTDVEQRVKTQFPVLAALANGDILFLAAESPTVTDDARKDLSRLFVVESILRPFHEMLGLSRQDLLRAARSNLPFWQTIPIINGIVRMLRRLLSPRTALTRGTGSPAGAARRGGGAEPAGVRFSSEASARAADDARSSARVRSELRSLLAQYLPAGKAVDRELADLAEKWNPLFEPEQKINLVDDVNALVRDTLRPLRRSLLGRPLTQDGISAVARQICGHRNLLQIRKRETLLRYVELYVIRTLQAGL
ncbi:MAG TPA: hypothetical protein VMV03_09840 [Spirochaetia bacterium]|nr:hypothetical protein [Spirochaetia bacterium]